MIKNNFITISVIGFVLLLWSPLAAAQAQTNTDVIITWQAGNFYPSDYPGKALPTNGSNILASVEVIKNSKIKDISKSIITWHLDNNFLKEGVGLKNISFSVTKARGGTHYLRATVINDNETLETTSPIPVTDFSVAIKPFYPAGIKIKSGTKLVFQAIPYFFNISSLDGLSFLWKINNEEIKAAGDNQLVLNVGAPTNNQELLSVSLNVQSVKNRFETANKLLELLVIP